MCVLSIKVPIRKKYGNFLHGPRSWALNVDVIPYLALYFELDSLDCNFTDIYSISFYVVCYVSVVNSDFTTFTQVHKEHFHGTYTVLIQYLYTGHILFSNSSNSSIAQSAGACRIHRLHVCRGVRPHHECPGYNIKQSDGEVPVMMGLWVIRNTPSLSILPGPLWSGMIGPYLWVKYN